jgi:D-mannonate dehydratase
MARMIEVVGQAGITSVLQIIDICKPIDPIKAEECWDGLIEIYGELVPLAESNGVGIGIHTLHRLLPEKIRERAVTRAVKLDDYGHYMADGWGGPFLVATYKDLRRLINAVPSPSNGVMMCSGMDFVGADLPALIREFAGKIHCVGFRDHSEFWPAGREVPLGEGRVDFRSVLTALVETDYVGIWAPEHLGQPRFDGEDLFAKGVDYIEAMITEVRSQLTQ